MVVGGGGGGGGGRTGPIHVTIWQRMGLVTRGQMLLLSGIKRRGGRGGGGVSGPSQSN